MEHHRQLPPVGIRWTIGDVSLAGFEALHLSIWGMWGIFGANAQYAVCVNTISTARAIEYTGQLPCRVEWLRADELIPAWLRPRVGADMAEGVAWKFAPVRLFSSLYEISLDNDVICWALPLALDRWLQARDATSCVLAADLSSALGQFGDVCNHRPLNSGIRGLPPEFPIEEKLRQTLSCSGITLKSELDEQGLQAAALQDTKLFIVDTDDVSICSPFPNHSQQFGRAGAHFIGVNSRHLPWTLQGRFAHEVIQDFWELRKAQMTALLLRNGDGTACVKEVNVSRA
jgi:hypothetical protein